MYCTVCWVLHGAQFACPIFQNSTMVNPDDLVSSSHQISVSSSHFQISYGSIYLCLTLWSCFQPLHLKVEKWELCPSLVPEKHRGFLAHATCEPGAGRKMWRQNVETYINRSQVFKVAGPSQNFGIISSSSIFIGVARIITYPFKKHLKHLLRGLFWKTPNIQRHLFYRTLPGLGRHSPGRAGSFSCQKVVSAFHNVK